MSGIEDRLEEREQVEELPLSLSALWLPSRGALFLSLLLSLPFLFRHLQLHEESEALKGSLHALQKRSLLERERVERLKRELSFLDEPEWVEAELIRRLWVIPRGARLIKSDH